MLFTRPSTIKGRQAEKESLIKKVKFQSDYPVLNKVFYLGIVYTIVDNGYEKAVDFGERNYFKIFVPELTLQRITKSDNIETVYVTNMELVQPV